MDWKIRLANADDIPFIYATWLNSYRTDSQWIAKETRRTIYYETYTKVIDKILLKSETKMAVLPEDPFVILGYLVHEPTVAHYAYTKDIFRQMGVFSSLLSTCGLIERYSHKTKYTQKLNLSGLDYDPFILSI